MIIFVGAYANNRVMGKAEGLPWPRMDADIARLHKLTHNKTVLMGEHTYHIYQGVKHAFGVSEVLVLSRSQTALPDAKVLNLDEFLKYAKDHEVWVIGGASIFALLIDKADKMYLTKIVGDFDGDVYFPEYSTKDWDLVKQEDFAADSANPYPYHFLNLERKHVVS